jgi:hypothetical protein
MTEPTKEVSDVSTIVKRSANELDDEDDDGFIPCADCDGHDACRDFGCAIKLGLGHMVRQPL